MKKQNAEKKIADMREDEVLKEKKKIDSHLVNLEFKKEQLLILIEKLYKISHERINLSNKELGHNGFSRHLGNAGAYLFSIAEQLKQAQNSRKEIEKEIRESKKQLETIKEMIKNKDQG